MAKIDHVPIGTLDIEAMIPIYTAIYGAEPGRYISVDGTTQLARFYLGEAMVELMEPIGQPEKGMGAATRCRVGRLPADRLGGRRGDRSRPRGP